MRFKLQKVQYMPKQLEPGILYVSHEFGTAAHLCACGCGAKIRTPLGPTEWAVTETSAGPSLWPSVGSWQQACKSHYVIERGKIEWALQWSDRQIKNGRAREELRREAYYKEIGSALVPRTRRSSGWLRKLFGG
jgi:hypothetical protein